MSAPGAAFDAAADTYDDDPHHALIADRLVAGLRPRPGLVVDVGTGTGFAALTALARLDPRRIVAVDVAPRMLERAAAKAATADPDGRIEWREAPAVPLELPVPADEAGAASIARDAGLVPVRVQTTPPATPDRPRRAFLVWADAA